MYGCMLAGALAQTQAGLKELAARHEADLKKMRRKLKASSAEVAALGDEVRGNRFAVVVLAWLW